MIVASAMHNSYSCAQGRGRLGLWCSPLASWPTVACRSRERQAPISFKGRANSCWLSASFDHVSPQTAPAECVGPYLHKPQGRYTGLIGRRTGMVRRRACAASAAAPHSPRAAGQVRNDENGATSSPNARSAGVRRGSPLIGKTDQKPAIGRKDFFPPIFRPSGRPVGRDAPRSAARPGGAGPAWVR